MNAPSPVIELHEVSKAYGPVTALERVTLRIGPGRICGLVGGNGAGKSTLLRVLTGLAAPASGQAHLFGCPYRELVAPWSRAGAALEPLLFHSARTGRVHLRVVATAAGIPAARVEEVLAAVELSDAAGRRVGGYSLGMRQRLTLATALLGRPQVLILDEPANGLDPRGRSWLFGLLRGHADAGGTVLLSSHSLAELETVIDEIAIIDRGRLLAHRPLDGLRREGGGGSLEQLYLTLTSYEQETSQ